MGSSEGSVVFRLDDFLPRVIPSKYREVAPPPPLLKVYPPERVRAFESVMHLRVFMSLDDFRPIKSTGGVWLHASCSYARQLPRWRDLKEVHELFMQDRPAVQMMPPKRYWLNAHPYTLHLWSRLDADTIPEIIWKTG